MQYWFISPSWSYLGHFLCTSILEPPITDTGALCWHNSVLQLLLSTSTLGYFWEKNSIEFHIIFNCSFIKKKKEKGKAITFQVMSIPIGIINSHLTFNTILCLQFFRGGLMWSSNWLLLFNDNSKHTERC